MKQPWHTSMLTGQMWVLELLAWHPECICTHLGVHSHVFYAIIDELHALGYTDSKFVTLEEQLAIFLYCSVTSLTVRHLGEWLQRSNDTITLRNLLPFLKIWYPSSYFKKMVNILSSPPFYTNHMILPNADNPVIPEIWQNPKFWLYFQGALGAIDGSHINFNFAAPASLWDIYQNRKGFISQNCFFACKFGLQFCYALTGWEGSITDAHLWHNSIDNDFVAPDGKYYLENASFPACEEVLLPYWGVCYHLSEWGCDNVQYDFIIEGRIID